MTAKIYHAELWGKREDKYNWLLENDLKSTRWRKISPKSEFYLFVPRNEKLLRQYEAYPKINDIFPVNSVGIVTARDELTIQWTKENVWQTVLNFSKLDPELARQSYDLGKDARDWKVAFAQKDLKESGLDRKKITPVLYRPFDIRYTYYTGKSRGFICMPRTEVMQHMMEDNLGLCVCRQQNTTGFYHAFATNIIIESCIVSNQTREISYIAPLYLYISQRTEEHKRQRKPFTFGRAWMLFEPEAEYITRKPNLDEKLLKELAVLFKKEPSPEEIFYYIYAILYSETYRTKFAEFLKIDFPRVPFTASYKLFKKMSEYGNRLADLHLLKSVDLDKPIARFQGKGDSRVAKPVYNDKTGRVSINTNQYFEGISPQVWSYQIGGYQVCEKWLKDRKQRILTLEEIQTYCRIVTALHKTIEIQKSIDEIYEEVEL